MWPVARCWVCAEFQQARLLQVRFFFASSAAFHRQLTELYDVIHPAAAAMWNLRWQVKGYIGERPSTSNEELHGRFVAGSGIGSANLIRHCVESGWDQQQGELALLAMYAGISLYEGWVAALEFGTTDERKQLQFPSRGTDGRTKAGAGDVVDRYQSVPSPVIERIFGSTLRANSRYRPDRLEDLLLAYRCFKEARNSSAHAGRVANDIAETAFLAARDRVSGLGARGGSLSLPQLLVDQQVAVTLWDVQALWATMLTLVTTLDVELATTAIGQAALIDRWRSVHRRRMLSGEATKRRRQLIRMSNLVHLPHVDDPDELFNLLKSEHLVV